LPSAENTVFYKGSFGFASSRLGTGCGYHKDALGDDAKIDGAERQQFGWNAGKIHYLILNSP